MIFFCFRYVVVILAVFFNLSEAREVLNNQTRDTIVKDEIREGSKGQIGDIVIKQLWVRPSRLENSAAYMIIENKGSGLDQLISAETEACDYVELHRIEEINDVFHMKKVDAIDIPAGSSTILKPGGMHVMLMKLKYPLKVDQKVILKFVFAKAGTITLEGNIQLKSDSKIKLKDHEVEELNSGRQ